MLHFDNGVFRESNGAFNNYINLRTPLLFIKAMKCGSREKTILLLMNKLMEQRLL